MSMTLFSASIAQLPRILGLMDRDSGSMTYGCCDRAYWHYCTVDFPNARYQEASLVLAMATVLDHPDNWAFCSLETRAWSLAAIDFWANRRHGDGSTDESYPCERHFCSTAFSLYSVCQALLVLKEDLRWNFDETARFLIRNNNFDVANQMACAAAALYNLFILTGNKVFRKGYEDKVDSLLRMQNRSGAFNEYGGFDLGYDSITLSFLAELFKNTSRQDIEKAAGQCLANIRGHLDEDAYFSSDGMSRKTQFLYPYGFSVFAPDILSRIEQGLSKNVILQPAWMDDRYCVPFTANYIKTALELLRNCLR